MSRTAPMSLAALNAATKDEFMRVLGDVVEHSPWVAERAHALLPFISLDDLTAKLMACIRESGPAVQVALFNRHPELAGHEAVAGEMTASSTGEQGRLGLDRLPATEHHRLLRINRQHRQRFGYPFIAALRLHPDLESVMRAGEDSLTNGREAEVERTLQQISAIVHGRLCKVLS